MKIWKDLKRIEGEKANIITFLDNIAFNTGFQAVLLYRISNWAYKYRVPVLPRALNFLGRLITSSDISYAADISEGLLIIHGMGVVIGANVKIGKNAKLLNDCTLGNRLGADDNKLDGQPILGDNVIIGVGSRLLGPITIGNDVRIGANSVVLTSVPDGCTAVGSPARIINKKE